ncbi:MAG: hypothetical protein Q4F84_07875, partial [Fibrobacter sp.]|nr:hypothetical protein [Fibrobacter sp.]
HPVELLGIKNSYRVLYGEDLFGKLELQEKYLILQCDREIKSVLMSLRSGFINIYKKEKEIKSVLMDLFPRLLPLFSAILISVDRKMCRSESEIISGIEDLCGLGISALSDLFCNNQRFKKQNVDLLVRFVETIDKIENFVNEIRKNYTESK